MLGWLALIVATLAGLFLLFQSNTDGMDTTSAGLTAAGVLVLLALLYVATLKARWGEARTLRLAVFVVVLTSVTGAAWLAGKDRIATLIAGKTSASSDEQSARGLAGAVSVLIRRNAEGKFAAQGQINGTNAALLFDTGATAVMLKHSDADKAGIDVQALSFTTPVQTANGTVYAAPVRVRSLAIGLLKVDDVEALVAQPGSLNENLLGQSFLRRLTSYDLTGDFLTLRE